jgi:hypothetical protein
MPLLLRLGADCLGAYYRVTWDQGTGVDRCWEPLFACLTAQLIAPCSPTKYNDVQDYARELCYFAASKSFS